ncbi:uncharacterized protein NPIL_82411 [Nephila pilipes]|uniref:Uncharacterized protein n=1 Tax=Nephila pilipes TaxID=299642 RepID=A0A8X6UTN0_NEPPI|nr:uncharacterized protein NPIL_82411 [Nephila pilipes]
MEKLKGGTLSSIYSTKKESDIPIAPCQGWTSPCEFCDKRFGTWVESNEENIPKIPTKPGIFLLGLKNKNSTEVVDIAIAEHDLQKQAYSSIDRVYERVADKKFKITKSVVIFRWMTFQQKTDKDVMCLCAHWYNNGVLPKFLNLWPGLNLLRQTDNLMFSDDLQKWCHPKKDAFWRKPKSTSTKAVEAIKSCNWTQPCEICDAYFGKWKSLEDVIDKHQAPNTTGIYIIGLKYGDVTEVVDIWYREDTIKINIKDSIDRFYKKEVNSILWEYKHLRDKHPVFQVRWLIIRGDVDSENCCFLYAHWMNAAPHPQSSLPGEEILEKNERFLFRNPDKKWCYGTEFYKQFKTSKTKIKRNIVDELREDIRYFRVSDCE